MTIDIPQDALVVLIGPAGSGKSTFAREHFRSTEVVSSDACRALVADDENAQDATADAFALLHFIVRRRLRAGRLTVVDATNVKPQSRAVLLTIARRQRRPAVAVVLNLPEAVYRSRNGRRADRSVPADSVSFQRDLLVRSLPLLDKEGFAGVHVLDSEQPVAAASVRRTPGSELGFDPGQGPAIQTSLPLG